MKKKPRAIITLIINITVVLIFITALLAFPEEFREEISTGDNLSRIFPLGFISLCLEGVGAAAYILSALIPHGGTRDITEKASFIIKYIAVCTTFVSFAVALVCLSPGMGYARFISGINLYVFLLMPIVSFIETAVSDCKELARGKSFFTVLMPILAFTVVRIIIKICGGVNEAIDDIIVFIIGILALLFLQTCAGLVFNSVRMAKIKRKVRITKHKKKNNPAE